MEQVDQMFSAKIAVGLYKLACINRYRSRSE
jgi:hypothetical protein